MWIGAVRYQQGIKILVRGVKTVGAALGRAIVSSDALLRRELQAVADAELGQDMGRAGRVELELLPQPANEDPQILHLFALRRAPDLPEQMPVGQYLAGMHDEMA